MEHWAEAQKTLKNADINADIELPLKIIQNANIPIILTENDTIINTINIEDEIVKDKTKASTFLGKLKTRMTLLLLNMFRVNFNTYIMATQIY